MFDGWKKRQKARQKNRTKRQRARHRTRRVRSRERTKRREAKYAGRTARTEARQEARIETADERWGGLSNLGNAAADVAVSALTGEDRGGDLLADYGGAVPTGGGMPDWALPVGVVVLSLVFLATNDKKKKGR